MTFNDPLMQEVKYILDPSIYEPELRQAYDILYRRLLEKYEAALTEVSKFPDAVIRELGGTLDHDRTPLSTLATVLNRCNYPNITDPFEIIVRMMLRELISSDRLVNRTQRQAEYLRNNIASRIIKLYKELGP
jgi:hypothetical protein